MQGFAFDFAFDFAFPFGQRTLFPRGRQFPIGGGFVRGAFLVDQYIIFKFIIAFSERCFFILNFL